MNEFGVREKGRPASDSESDTWRQGEDRYAKPDSSAKSEEHSSRRSSGYGSGAIIDKKGDDWNKTLNTTISIPAGPEARADEHEAHAAAENLWDDLVAEGGGGFYLTSPQM